MRVAIRLDLELTDAGLTFAEQLGVAGIDLVLPHHLRPDMGVDELRELRAVCERRGLRLESIEQVPVTFYDKAMLGLPGRDEQIERYCGMVRDFGAAGIPILGLHWMPSMVWRTSPLRARGGALVTAFDTDEVDDALVARQNAFVPAQERSADEIWDAFEYFMAAVLPVAEAAGVRIALHPDDPPVPSLGGIARIFSSRAGFDRALERFASPAMSLMFCVGTWSEMAPSDCPGGVLDALATYARADRVAYVHFRDVRGHVPRFRECFLGEGNLDPVEIIAVLRDANYAGFVIDDHVPAMVGDTGPNDRGRAYQTGFIQGLVAATAWTTR